MPFAALRAGSDPSRPWIMGILNCTPDSFYDGGVYDSAEALVAHGREMIADGADIIDIGGESTRPGSDPVAPAEQIRRTRTVIEALRGEWDGAISIDTTSAEVAQAALAAGANWINDISALRGDPRMGEVAASAGAAVVLMHMQGTPRTMQDTPRYHNVVEEVASFLEERAARAESVGIAHDCIILDPGIGFGKTVGDNLEILGRLSRFCSIGYPILVGASRKSFIGAVTGDGVMDRIEGSLAAAVFASLHGARILRVHDVRATARVLAVTHAIAKAGASS